MVRRMERSYDVLAHTDRQSHNGGVPHPFLGMSSVRTSSAPLLRRLTKPADGLLLLFALIFLAAVSLSGCAAEPDALPAATVRLGQEVPPLVATCSNGVAVPDPEKNPGLVGDCALLLEAWNTLGGKGRLGWYPRLPIKDWMGVTVEGKPKRVRRLEIFGFQLIGKIPGNLGKLTALEHLDLSINELHREIPAELGGLTNLESLDLQVNNLTGEIPASLGRLQNLEKLYLAGNQLTGCIPQPLLDISDHDLDRLVLPACGNGPTEPRAESPTPPAGSVLACSNGTAVPEPYYDPQLIMDCSILLEVREILAGSADLDWDPSRSIRQWQGVGVDRRNGHLHWLELPQIGLTGRVPRELGRLVNLEMLILEDNQLTGEVPSELGQLRNLQGLFLQGNRLSGPIPAELGGLARLRDLVLSETGVSGEIPPELGDLSSLEGLELRENRLTGMIPPELGRLSNLWQLDLADNRLRGVIPPELGELTEVSGLNLSDNQLTGEIPAELGRLPNLKQLHLEGNQLNGEIPPELGEIRGLRQLILRDNELTGEIPEGLLRADRLGRLDLSGNDLSGEIPDWLTGLGGLTLLRLEGNEFTGCVPGALLDIFDNDLDRLGLPPC